MNIEVKPQISISTQKNSKQTEAKISKNKIKSGKMKQYTSPQANQPPIPPKKRTIKQTIHQNIDTLGKKPTPDRQKI